MKRSYFQNTRLRWARYLDYIPPSNSTPPDTSCIMRRQKWSQKEFTPKTRKCVQRHCEFIPQRILLELFLVQTNTSKRLTSRGRSINRNGRTDEVSPILTAVARTLSVSSVQTTNGFSVPKVQGYQGWPDYTSVKRLVMLVHTASKPGKLWINFRITWTIFASI